MYHQWTAKRGDPQHRCWATTGKRSASLRDRLMAVIYVIGFGQLLPRAHLEVMRVHN